MDFRDIISTAQQNISSSNEKGKFYSTKFEPPKKMTKEKRLTVGIQKFLEDKKREDEEKAERDRVKKQDLISRRDPKVQRKIDKTLKVIKSSKKYYTGDSTLDENTAITLEDQQPDDDDYGFGSTVSDEFHRKLMEKYQKLPEDKKFSSGLAKNKALSKEEMNSTKNRIKNALATNEDDHQPVRIRTQHRTSKMKNDLKIIANGAGSSINSAKEDRKAEFKKPKPKLKAAPIVDFQELLKLAAQKQHEEVTIDVPTKKEPERLLTMKEKRELEEIEAAKRARMKPNRIPKLGGIPRVGEPSKNDRNNNENSGRKPVPSMNPSTKPSAKSSFAQRSQQSAPERQRLSPVQSASSKLRDALQKQNGSSSSRPSSNSKVPINSKRPGLPSAQVAKSREAPVKSTLNGQKPSSSNVVSKADKYRPSTSSSKEPERTRDFPPKDLMRSREFPPKDLMRSREFPPKDLMRSREFPPKDTRKLTQQQVSRKRRVIEDEDSEYDSEMDDFIDDDDAQGDYSSEIKKIFGYDKSRYRDEDFDDSQMESDYRTVMREEFISKKMGILEDLEDMKMEAEEKKHKEMRKKRKL